MLIAEVDLADIAAIVDKPQGDLIPSVIRPIVRQLKKHGEIGDGITPRYKIDVFERGVTVVKRVVNPPDPDDVVFERRFDLVIRVVYPPDLDGVITRGINNVFRNSRRYRRNH